MGRDRRASPRMTFPATVYIHNAKQVYSAAMVDIGLGGLAIFGPPQFSLGTPVRIVVKSEWLEAPLQARGIVVRVGFGDRSFLAVQFTIPSKGFESILHKTAVAQGEPSWKWVA